MFKKIFKVLLTSLFITLIPVSVNAADLGAAPIDVNALLMAQAAQAQALQAAQVQALQAAQAAQAQAIQAAQAAQAQALQQAQEAQLAQPESASQAAGMALSLPDFVYVDISDQMAYMYRNGILVTSGNCVTGNEKAGYNTTRGIHQIVFMDTNRTLHGSYGEARVKYWMRFTSGGQGLHDAGWRSKFGGTIYKTNGSHGCVNLPRPVAETMYSYAYVGLPVIVVD